MRYPPACSCQKTVRSGTIRLFVASPKAFRGALSTELSGEVTGNSNFGVEGELLLVDAGEF